MFNQRLSSTNEGIYIISTQAHTVEKMFHTAAKQLEDLEAQLASITKAVGSLRESLSQVADTRRVRCSKAYHKDIKKTRENRNAYYQRVKTQRAVKVPCAHCGKNIRLDYMKRHMKTSRCASVKGHVLNGSSDTPQGQRPGQLLEAAL